MEDRKDLNYDFYPKNIVDDAYQGDFGATIDEDEWNAPDYGCGCKVFKRYTEKDNIKKCMDKYSLTWEEYYDICDILEEVLYVGTCSWCS